MMVALLHDKIYSRENNNPETFGALNNGTKRHYKLVKDVYGMQVKTDI